MHKEKQNHNWEMGPLVQGLAEVFIQRRDLYAKQLEDGSYLCIRKPLKDWHLKQHLDGKLTLGAYMLSQENQTRFREIMANVGLKEMRYRFDLEGTKVMVNFINGVR